MDPRLNRKLSRKLQKIGSAKEKLISWIENATKTSLTFEQENDQHDAVLQKMLDDIDRAKAKLLENFEKKALQQVEIRQNDIEVYDEAMEELKERKRELEEVRDTGNVDKAEKILKKKSEFDFLFDPLIPSRTYKTVKDLVVIPHTGKVSVVSEMTVDTWGINMFVTSLIRHIERMCSIQKNENEDGTFIFTFANRAFKFSHSAKVVSYKDGSSAIHSEVHDEISLKPTTGGCYNYEVYKHENKTFDEPLTTFFDREEDAVRYIFALIPDLD